MLSGYYFVYVGVDKMLYLTCALSVPFKNSLGIASSHNIHFMKALLLYWLHKTIKNLSVGSIYNNVW